MAEDMQQDAIDCATQDRPCFLSLRCIGSCARSHLCACLCEALEKYNIEKDIAAFIKKEHETSSAQSPACESTVCTSSPPDDAPAIS